MGFLQRAVDNQKTKLKDKRVNIKENGNGVWEMNKFPVVLIVFSVFGSGAKMNEMYKLHRNRETLWHYIHFAERKNNLL